MPQSITSIPNQTIQYFTDDDASCKCGEREHCILVAAGQQVYSQLKISPCGDFEVCNNELGDELICNGGFDLGEELVTNGTFTGSATGWTLGAGWAYETNDVRATAAAGQLGQTISALVTGKAYLVTFTISDFSAGDIRVRLGGTFGTTRSADGTYSELIISGASTAFSLSSPGGSFSADIDDVSVKLLDCWSYDTGWMWTNGLMCGDGAQNLAQELVGLVDFDDYQVTFTISNYVAGDLTVTLGGTSYSPTFTADGTYTITINNGNADENIFFSGAGTFEGCVDNVSVKHIENCWDTDGTDWVANAIGACHETGNTTDLTNTGTPIVSGKYYHITINISASTAGGINVVIGTNVLLPSTGDPQTVGNGTFHFWGVSDGTDLIVRPTSDFDGCISTLLVDEYCNEYEFHLVPASGDEFEVVDLTSFYVRFEDTYNLSNFRMSDIMKSGLQLAYGCYKFCLVDCCTEQQTAASLLRNGDFADGSAFWTAQGITFAGGAAVFVPGQEINSLEQALISTHDADCIELEFGFITESPGVPISIFINGVLVDQEVLLLGGGFYNNTFSNVPAGAVITFTTSNLDVELFIDDITVTVPEECQPLYDQCTPCINYQASFQCTKLVEGFCDGNALGFSFDDSSGNNQFKLSLRAKCELLHPTYDQEQEDYDYSTGDSSLSFGQSKKLQSLTFFPLPEFKHDVIALEKICDTFQIDAVDYFVKQGDYTPEWNRNSATDLAPSRIEVKKKNQTLYNTSC